MNNAELEELIKAWVAYVEAEEGTPEYKNNWWAVEKVMDWDPCRV